MNGLASLVQSGGMGAFEPNCLLAQWPKDVLALGREGIERRSNLVTWQETERLKDTKKSEVSYIFTIFHIFSL